MEPILERPHPYDPNGVQCIYRFHNLMGASVIRNKHSYGGKNGLWGDYASYYDW